MKDIRMPEWIDSDEKVACYKEILELAKQIKAEAVIAEDENTCYFLLEIDEEQLSTEVKDLMYDFNDGTKTLLCDVVLERNNVRGERYCIF